MDTDVLLSWSGGKDGSLALQEMVRSRYSVKTLFATVTEEFDRISMHGVRLSLLRAQASSLGLPVMEVLIPGNSSNETYEARMRAVLTRCSTVYLPTVGGGVHDPAPCFISRASPAVGVPLLGFGFPDAPASDVEP